MKIRVVPETCGGGSERVIVAKLVFPGDPSTVNRALAVTQAGLNGAMREQVEPCAELALATRLPSRSGMAAPRRLRPSAAHRQTPSRANDKIRGVEVAVEAIALDDLSAKDDE